MQSELLIRGERETGGGKGGSRRERGAAGSAPPPGKGAAGRLMDNRHGDVRRLLKVQGARHAACRPPGTAPPAASPSSGQPRWGAQGWRAGGREEGTPLPTLPHLGHGKGLAPGVPPPTLFRMGKLRLGRYPPGTPGGAGATVRHRPQAAPAPGARSPEGGGDTQQLGVAPKTP